MSSPKPPEPMEQVHTLHLDARTELRSQWEHLRSQVTAVMAEKESAFMTLIDQLQLPAHDTTIVETDSPEPSTSRTSPVREEWSTFSPIHSGAMLRMSEEKQEMFQKATTTSQRNFRHSQTYRRYLRHDSKLGYVLGAVGCRSCLNWIVDKVETLWQQQEPPRKGCLAYFVDSAAFQFVTTTVILLNCLTLLASANWSMENQSFDVPVELRAMDLSFTAFYVIELLLKFLVHRLFLFYGTDWKWNWFDFILVLLAVQEQVFELLVSDQSVSRLSYMRSLRVVRLSRVLRLLRAIRVVRELRMMVFSIISSFNALFWCLVLITLVICVFALFFLQISTDYLVLERESIDDATYEQFLFHFGSLEKTMRTLYLATTGGFDWENALYLITKAGQGGGWAFLFYIAFFNFAVFNVLTGMFVDHAMKWSQSDNQNMIAEHRNQELQDAARLRHLCQAIDLDNCGRISWEDFEVYVSDESALIQMASLGLEIHDAKTFFDMLTGVAGDRYVDIDTFVTGCMRMKGPATSIDMLSMAYEITLMHRQSNRIEKKLMSLAQMQKKFDRFVGDMCAQTMSSVGQGYS